MKYEPNGWNRDVSNLSRLECNKCKNKFNILSNFINTETGEEIKLCDNCKTIIIK